MSRGFASIKKDSRLPLTPHSLTHSLTLARSLTHKKREPKSLCVPDFLLASKNLSLSHSLTSLTKHKHMVLLKISLTHSTLTHPTHSLTHSYQSIRQGPPDALAALLVSLHRVPVHQRPTSVSACQLFSVLHVCDWLSETGLLTASFHFRPPAASQSPTTPPRYPAQVPHPTLGSDHGRLISVSFACEAVLLYTRRPPEM